MLEAGASTEDVAAQVGSFLQAVRSLRRRFVPTGSTEDPPRSGRPRVTTYDRYILKQYLRNRSFFNCDSYSVCHPRYL